MIVVNFDIKDKTNTQIHINENVRRTAAKDMFKASKEKSF